MLGVSRATQITSRTSACALIDDGSVRCWGASPAGDGTFTDHGSAVVVVGVTDAIHVSAGYGSTCVLIRGGSVKCWGGNGVVQLGNGNYRDSQTPVDVVALP